MSTYDYPKFPYPPPAAPGGRERAGVVVVGAGPVGLAAAAELARHGIASVLLDEDDTVSRGSRAICWSKRTLEILDRAGVAGRMVAKGVNWSRGHVYHGDGEVYGFDLLPEPGHRMPAFINLQQYYVEQYLAEHAARLAAVDLRWRHKAVGVDNRPDGVSLAVETPDGRYALDADWVIAADGVRSPIRHMLGLPYEGQRFEDRFLIADVRIMADYPNERRFWFEPPFHAGQSVLLHRQADHVYRIDFQLGSDADPEEAAEPETVAPRIRRMLGPDVPFEFEWISVYTFSCRRLARFRHGRLLFAGDAAHVVSPFGARGGNGGIQDVDNLAWKLAWVIRGQAPDRLLDSYDAERGPAADENLLNSTRSTDFITPKHRAAADFRKAVLTLAADCPFARRLVNSGRLSLPHAYAATPLSTPDADTFDGGVPPGAPAPDAPVAGGDGWLLGALGGGFRVLHFRDAADAAPAPAVPGAAVVSVFRAASQPLPLVAPAPAPGPIGPLADIRPAQDGPRIKSGATSLEGGATSAKSVATRGGSGATSAEGGATAGEGAAATVADGIVLTDTDGLAFRRYAARPGTVYLIRPDQHVAARWHRFDPAAVAAALRRATGQEDGDGEEGR